MRRLFVHIIDYDFPLRLKEVILFLNLVGFDEIILKLINSSQFGCALSKWMQQNGGRLIVRREEGRVRREEGRVKREEGRMKSEEGRVKKETDSGSV
nr:hypothetical protein [uncultured Prevotella sp.]